MGTSSVNYDDVLEQVRRLDHNARRRLLDALTEMFAEEDPKRERRSILELRGLGKEVWEGIDTDEYLARERAAWTK